LASVQDWGTKPPGGKVDEQIMQLMHLDEIVNAEAENALISDFWLPETQVAGARDMEGSTEGFFFCAKGGHNAESHNHNDLGTCVLYFDSKPCLVDIGRETYTAKTFSSRRYEIWTMQSGYHQLPKINGVDQMQGRNYVAKNSTFSADSKKAVFSTDIAAAYPQEANVKKWVRSYRLDRGKKFTISDNYELNETTGPTSLNFITSNKVVDNGDGTINLEGDGFTLQMNYDTKMFSAKIEETEITDRGLSRYWDVISRIVLVYKNPKLKGKSQVVLTQVE
jgi:hypothetical protein